ncbi:MAG: DUF2975 domain-containing protein [Patescibacteria group bacterium]|nr:DUF2975 domain-containing protein [Patescibacteria group bacterium]
MKLNLTIFLQIVIVALGIVVLTAMLWEPHLEGRNAHSTFFEIYFKDPFLAYAYVSSLAFFIALYQTFKVLEYVRQNKTYSPTAIKALRTIKYCALTLVVLILGAEGYLFIAIRGKDDIAGGAALGLFMIFGSAIIAAVAAVFERTLQNTVNIKFKTN